MLYLPYFCIFVFYICHIFAVFACIRLMLYAVSVFAFVCVCPLPYSSLKDKQREIMVSFVSGHKPYKVRVSTLVKLGTHDTFQTMLINWPGVA